MNRFGITLALLLIGQNLAAASAESRLEAAKNAMVDQALSQPTRVHSAAWVDENGVLHEQNRFQSEGSVRGIRMLNYLPKAEQSGPELDPAQSLLAVEQEETNQVLAAPAAEAACENLPGLAQVAVLDLEILTSPSSGAAGYARQLEAETRRLLLRRFEGAEGWRLAPRHEASQLQSPYERAVYEGPVNRRPLQLTLALAVREAKQRPRWWDLAAKAAAPLKKNFGPYRQRQPALELDLELRLSAAEDPTFLWAGYDSFPLETRGNDWSPKVLPSDVQRIYGTLNQWFSALDARQSCEVPRYAVQRQVRGQFVVSGGRQAGLKPGDKVILADGLRTPEDVLNQGVDSTMALAEIRWVDEEEAGLAVLSGPTPLSSDHLVAIPL